MSTMSGDLKFDPKSNVILDPEALDDKESMPNQLDMKESVDFGNVQADENKVTVEKCYLSMPDGYKVHARYWKPPLSYGLKALIFVSHGLGEHLEWYNELGMLLAEHGYLVFGHDHLGHGLSEGSRGYIQTFDTLVSHVMSHVSRIKMDNQGVPCFIYGHSMGGNVALRAILQNGGFFRGMVLEGPLIKVNDETITFPKFMLAQLANLIVPEFPTEQIPLDAVTSDLDTQQQLRDDPLRYNQGIKVGTALAMLESLKIVGSALSEIDIPFLTMHGKLDTLCMPRGSEDLHARAKAQDKQIIMFPNAKHHLILEIEDVRNQAVAETLSWLEQRCI
ncbi:hypothetical protein TCAL_03424 [Tigriopus californicus]|uniref:Serine aminopeptidase S33 domain-containing protein n=1 Tax=Tigriopus californicus TaxID=6832 RepID=A0A553P3N4_TIGCA|nr:monoglyceride lipase-like isoform X1 [Tigriopus californicus]XP_059086711.1 monoglyceride lipase-like isoform X1 [Tigriopus californicus]TRY72306.1 hypothetical protein TCAL_03424 [Tigriopus californicus]